MATLATIVGLVLTAGGVSATSASWLDSVDFAIEVTGATTSTSTTTTMPTSTSSSTTTTTTTTTPTTTSSSTSTSTTTSTSSSTTTTTTTEPPPPSVSEGGISAANAETVITDIAWDQPDSRQVCTVVSVTGIDSEPWEWAIKVDVTVAPWYGISAQHVSVRGTGTTIILSPTVVLVTGSSNGGPWDPRTNNTPITNEQTALVTICSQTPPVPSPADVSWYEVTTTDGVWTDTEACVVVTASPTGAASGPFFFGWTAMVDLTAAKAWFTDAGRKPKKVSWSPQPNGAPGYSVSPTGFNPPADTYTITSGYDFALRAGGGSKTTTVCVTGK